MANFGKRFVKLIDGPFEAPARICTAHDFFKARSRVFQPHKQLKLVPASRPKAAISARNCTWHMVVHVSAVTDPVCELELLIFKSICSCIYTDNTRLYRLVQT